MRTFILFFYGLFATTLLFAQTPQRAVLQLNKAEQIHKISKLKNARTIYRSTVQVVPIQKVTPFLAYSITHQTEDLKLWIRFSEEGENWSDWEKVKKDIHEGEIYSQLLLPPPKQRVQDAAQKSARES